MRAKSDNKVAFPYKVKVLQMENSIPLDAFTFDCRDKEEVDNKVNFIKRVVGSKSQTASNIHVLP